MSRRSGFSMIEMITVIAIISVLSTILISFGGTTRQQVALQVEGAKITQMIARARTLAVTTRRGAADTTCGYSLFIDYSLRVMRIERYTDPTTGANACQFVAPTYITEETSPLDANVTFGPDAGGMRLIRIIFVPPDPTVRRYGASGVIAGGYAQIPLQTTGGTLTLSVSPTGQVSY